MLSWFGIKSQNNEESANKESNNGVNVDDESSEKTAEASRGDGEEASVEESTGPKTGPNKPNNAKSASMEAVGAAVGFFRNFATAAGKTAYKLKESVDEKLDKTIIGELERENERFVREKHSKRTEDPVPPWVGYNEEEEIKTQILSLSSDERHFLRDPPSGVEFHFDLDAVMPIALTILEEDKQLQAMRFKLVPKKIKEEKFWRNYFYRVSLIKQSSQLSTLANSELKRSSSSLNQDSKRNSKSDLEKAISDASNDDTTKDQNQSKPEDRLRATEKDANDKSRTERSSSTKQDAETDDWEKELQDELQDFEFVSEDQGGEHENNPEWEKEIENMLGLDEEDDSESKTN